MDNTTAPTVEIGNQPIQITPQKPTKAVKIILSLVLLVVLTTLFYFLIYRNLFLKFKPLAVLDYDKTAAQKIVNTITPIAFTRNQDLFLGDLDGNEILLVPQNKNLTKKIAEIKISKTRQYITWQVESGILGLDLPSKKVFLIHTGEPRQSYDLSPNEDTILFITKSQLLGVKLRSGYIEKKLTLPRLENPDIHFNHVKYSPNSKLAYMRSIHQYKTDEFGVKGPEDTIIELDNASISFLDKDYSIPVNLAPLWFPSSDSLIIYNGNFIRYSVSEKSYQKIEMPKINHYMKPYAINPVNQSIALISYSSEDEMGKKRHNPEVVVVDPKTQKAVNILDSVNEKLLEVKNKYNFSAIINDLGWLDENNLWIDYRYHSNFSNLMKIDVNTKEITLVLKDIDLFSLPSIASPVNLGYTLHEN